MINRQPYREIKAGRHISCSTLSLLLAGLLLLFISCEKMLLSPDPTNNPVEVFTHLWNDVNARYTYFEIKGINWDSIGGVYRNKIHDEMDDKSLFNTLGDMLFTLQDGHVNLTSDFDRSRNWEWFQNHPDNYNQNLIDRYYLRADFFITGPLHNQIIDSVLYVNYRSFTDQISQSHLDALMQRAKGLHGIIIDIRHNTGGSLQNGLYLASCFVNEPIVYARQRFKTGPGNEDYTSWGNMTIRPREGARFDGPVVLLTNRRSYSASSFFAQMMRVVPTATLMGDTTGGGGGIPVFGELPNGWTYRFSASQTITPDGDHIETGIPVDIKVNMHGMDERRGIDTIIRAALQHIKEAR